MGTDVAGILIVRSDYAPETVRGWITGLPAATLGQGRFFAAVERDFKYMPVFRSRPKYLMVFELSDVNALAVQVRAEMPESHAPDKNEACVPATVPALQWGLYQGLPPGRLEYSPPETNFLMAIGHDVPADKAEEYNAWYSTEHLPAMLRVPGFIAARRFVATERGASPGYLALYDINDDSAIDSDTYLKERDSPWSAWVRTWFKRRLAYIGHRIAR